MDRDEQFRRNNELFRIFFHQVLDSSGFAQLIPDGAEIVFLPEHDPELKEANLELVKTLEAEGKHVFLIKVTLVPETRTVFVPRLELVKSA
ncbi:MAG TPA: DUF5647 family protein [Dehalococcoidia bacterium]|nr:DUF5647 family protein [Dehalococcoidia bacterium]